MAGVMGAGTGRRRPLRLHLLRPVLHRPRRRRGRLPAATGAEARRALGAPSPSGDLPPPPLGEGWGGGIARRGPRCVRCPPPNLPPEGGGARQSLGSTPPYFAAVCLNSATAFASSLYSSQACPPQSFS